MRLLLTGFEPFGGSQVNPSELVISSLKDYHLPGLQLNLLLLPVDRFQAPREIIQSFNEIQPDAVLCLGEASGRPVVSVERVAINLLDFRIADNQGNKAADEPVMSGAPAAYFSTLPVSEIVQAIRSEEIPAELSLSAGAFLCNQVLFTILHHINITGSNSKAGFIHLPSLPAQGVNQKSAMATMALETSRKAVVAALGVISEMYT